MTPITDSMAGAPALAELPARASGPGPVASSAPAPAAAAQATSRISSGRAGEAQLQKAVDLANSELAQSGQQMEFVYDKSIDRTIVKVVDTQTNKVIKQIPAESMLVMARALAEHPAKGALIDQHV